MKWRVWSLNFELQIAGGTCTYTYTYVAYRMMVWLIVGSGSLTVHGYRLQITEPTRHGRVSKSISEFSMHVCMCIYYVYPCMEMQSRYVHRSEMRMGNKWELGTKYQNQKAARREQARVRWWKGRMVWSVDYLVHVHSLKSQTWFHNHMTRIRRKEGRVSSIGPSAFPLHVIHT